MAGATALAVVGSLAVVIDAATVSATNHEHVAAPAKPPSPSAAPDASCTIDFGFLQYDPNLTDTPSHRFFHTDSPQLAQCAARSADPELEFWNSSGGFDMSSATDGDTGAGHGETCSQGHFRAWGSLGMGLTDFTTGDWIDGSGTLKFTRTADLMTVWGEIDLNRLSWTGGYRNLGVYRYEATFKLTSWTLPGSPLEAACLAIGGAGDIQFTGTVNLWKAPAGSGVVWPAGTPAAVTVSPPAQQHQTGAPATVTAKVSDEVGAPVGNVPVTFTRTGSNPGVESVMTDATGEAVHTYTGITAGADAIVASAPGGEAASGIAGVVWDPDPETQYATAVHFDQPVVEGPIGTPLEVAFEALRHDGSPFANGTVRYAIGGAGTEPVFAGTATSDATGRGSISVKPLSRPLYVLAFADDPSLGRPEERDPSELLGGAAVVGTPPSPSPLPNLPPEAPKQSVPAHEFEFAREEPQLFALTTSDPNGDVWTAEVTVVNSDTNDVTNFTTSPAASGEDATGTPTPPLAPGTYTWTAVAKDAKGDQSPPSGEQSFKVLGNVPPTVPVLVEPDTDHWYSLTDTPTFTLSSTDAEGDAYSATVTIRDASTGDVVSSFVTTPANSGDESTGAPVPPLDPGSYTWTAKAKDVRGAESDESDERPFSVGNRPPVMPTMLAPEPAETLSTESSARFSVTANDPDGDPYAAVITVYDGTTVEATFESSLTTSGETATATPSDDLPVGTYTWTAKARDAHGGVSEESAPRAVSVSGNRPPEVPTMVSPPKGEVFHAEEPQVFTIATVDPEGAPYSGTVTVTNTGTGAVTTFSTTVAPSGGQASGSPTSRLIPGNYTWKAKATDAFGSSSLDSATRAFSVTDAQGPTPGAAPSPGPLTRASLGAGAQQATGGSSHDPSLSADGRYVAFQSAAANLVPQDTNGKDDIFVHDRVAGTTERVSVSSTAAPANDVSYEPAISANGRYVVFSSAASNLVAGDTNGEWDVFLHDRVTKATTRVSLTNSGGQATGGSSVLPSVSDSGRYVAFASAAANLVSGDTNAAYDVFVRDRTAGTTERISLSSSEVQGDSTSGFPSISADGRYVAFEAIAGNLVSGDTNAAWDVFVRDRTAGTTGRVSLSSSEVQGNNRSGEATISADGRYVAFESLASNLVSGDTNLSDDIFVRDRTAGTTERVSLSTTGAQGNNSSRRPAISRDGRFVVFQSWAPNLVAGDRNGSVDIFLRDRTANVTTLISHTPNGLQTTDAWSPWSPAVSDGGLHVAFDAEASNLVSGDTNGRRDVFAYNRHNSLDCAGGTLSAVGCLSGYGFKATSSDIGLEDFYHYHPIALGPDRGYLNVGTGNTVIQGTDLVVPGQGFNLRLTRTYNSKWDQAHGPLGKGWRVGIAEGEGDELLDSVLSAALSTDVGELIEVVATEDQFDFFDADGTRHHFIKGGLAGPGWHSPPGVNLVLSDVLVGGERRYRATRPDGVVYEFRPVAGSYALTSMTDRVGNALTFSYASGRLSSITDPTGRTLTFTWGTDYLSSVTFTGSGLTRTVNYTVGAATGRLTSVTTAGRTLSYTYKDPAVGWGLETATDGRGNTTTFSFTADGVLTQVVDRAGKTWNVAYNTPSCQPTTPEGVIGTCVIDPEGARTIYTVSAAGNVLNIRDAGDTSVNQRNFLWDANRLVWQADENGNTTEYSYNQWGQVVLKRETGNGEPAFASVFEYRSTRHGVSDLVKATAGAGSNDPRIWHFGVADNGNLLTTTDPLGHVTRFGYYVRGLLKSVKDTRGRTTTYGNTALSDGGYHPSGQPPTITDPLGETTTFTYDFLGRSTSRVDRNGHTWTTGYDARGNITTGSVPGAGTTTFTYDLNDNQLTATPPGGGAPRTNTYDARDLLTSSQSTIGTQLRKIAYVYGDDGQLKEILEPRTFAGSPPVTQKVTYLHYPNNRVSAMIDEEGARTDVTYTASGQVRTVRAPAGQAGRHTTAYTYNRRGQMTSVLESGHANPASTRHSIHGEPVSMTTPKGSTTTYAYDKLGRVIRATDANGRVSRRTYDPMGNLLRVSQPAGDGQKLTTSYSYTARNEIASESDPSDGAHVIKYAYDAEGRQRFRRDWYGGVVAREIEQTYRADGAMLERFATASGRASHRSNYTYDPAGNLLTATARLGGDLVSEVAFTYNAGFELTNVSESVYEGGTPITKAVSYTYHPDGLLASRTVDGLTTSYSYTRDGNEKTVDPWYGGGSFTHQYLANDAPRKTTLPNDVTIDRVFDVADRITSNVVRKSDGQTVLSSWTGMTYDDNDNRTSETVVQRQTETSSVPLLSGNATYSYDALDRVTSAKPPFEPKPGTYAFDDAGNVVTETAPQATAVYRYATNRLLRKTEEGSQSGQQGDAKYSVRSDFSHDPLGDLDRVQTLSRTRYTTQPTENDTVTVDLNVSNVAKTKYDAMSHTRRARETVDSYVEYAYDAFDRLVRRLEHVDGDPDKVELYFHDGMSESLVLETKSNGVVKTRYVLGSGGEPMAQETIKDDTTRRSYLIVDPRGNVSQVVAASEKVKAVFSYDAFGKARPAHTRTVEDWDSRLRFQGAPQDPTTGAYALGPRMYDPSINRFVGSDSYVGAAANMDLALDALTGNRYLYAGANPVNMIDNGHHPVYYTAPVRWKVQMWGSRGISWRFYSASEGEKMIAAGEYRLGPLKTRSTVTIWAEYRKKACPKCWKGVDRTYDNVYQRVLVKATRGAVNLFKREFKQYVNQREQELREEIDKPWCSFCSKVWNWLTDTFGKILNFFVENYDFCSQGASIGAGIGALGGAPGSALGGAIGCVGAYGGALLLERSME